jgi:hypothetical protein
VAWALETLVRRSQPAYEIDPMLRTYSERWEPASSDAAIEHPEQTGLWLLRRAVDSAGIAALRGLVASTMIEPRPRSIRDEAEAAEREAALLIKQAQKLPRGTEWAVEASEQAAEAAARRDRLRAAAAFQPAPPPPHRTATAWEWHPFEPGRLMAPMLSHEAADGVPFDSAVRHCSDFEVFGKAPVVDWLRLDALAEWEATVDDFKGGPRDVQRAGAQRLLRLQAELPRLLPCIARMVEPRCVFHQLQLLERGTAGE